MISILNEPLIIYGKKIFNDKLFLPVKNTRLYNKPVGGLWSCPINSKLSWKDFCIENNYGNITYHFKIRLKKNTKILKINSYKDLKAIPYTYICFDQLYLDYVKLATIYDVIWVTHLGIKRNSDYTKDLNLLGWDCESVFIMNINCFYLLY